VGGYLVSPDNAHCPIFVNYHKEDHISASTKYEDEFVNTQEFDWMSKSNRKIDSKDVQSILGKKGAIRLPLFIKKNNDEGMDFYYMGDVNPELNKVEQTTMKDDHGKKVSVVKIRFHLSNPVTTNMYNYLHEKIKVLAKAATDKVNMTKSKGTVNTEKNIKNPIPLYNFYAAAGTFSEIQSNKDYTLIEGPESRNSNDGYFACKIIGDSMNRVIPNNSICLFKPYSGGTRNGKILLIENIDIQDPDFNSAFTIKTYSSEKVVTEEGWEHSSILLRPNSFDNSYKEILINEENAQEMRIVGEFVSIITN
jgi:phage repressor protein C with HTH and peptisase S24 domain